MKKFLAKICTPFVWVWKERILVLGTTIILGGFLWFVTIMVKANERELAGDKVKHRVCGLSQVKNMVSSGDINSITDVGASYIITIPVDTSGDGIIDIVSMIQESSERFLYEERAKTYRVCLKDNGLHSSHRWQIEKFEPK